MKGTACTAFFRWLALSDEGPGAVPFGNDFMALNTSTFEMLTGEGVGMEGISEGGI